MRRYFYLLLTVIIFYGISPAIYAMTVTCTGPEKNSTLTLPPVNVVLGSNIPDYTPLYAIRRSYNELADLRCTPGTRQIRLALTLNGTSSAYKLPNEPSYDGFTHKIYPTDIPGLGISVITDETSPGVQYVPVPAWPDFAYSYTSAVSSQTAYGNWFSLYLWKIPGTLPAGSLAFTGPTVEFLVSPNSGDVLSSSSMEAKGTNLVWASMATKGSANLIRGTCNIVGGSKIVQMGTYDGLGGKSAWVDSSFKLDCPNAAGYGGGSSTTLAYFSNVPAPVANNRQNGPIRIQIHPRTGIVSDVGTPAGTIELDGTGATGYGIQLAWGDNSTLGAGTPASPVMFDTWIRANTLNPAAYRSTAYPINGAAITGDGTLKMAARYVRIPGRAISGGPANASVEVIASYE
ncbi:hypothetical protein [Citrobacter sp. MNAZ 1397]|uniref:fimbrial protein n=1 Tax=Citrobacter sp. MNAZ 1397 TaxID=2911205 RepID=UPI0020272195|nr:hypothetical protein [Citrobacter sp. MNAZ 1397]MCL9672289.1 hypothetical protein [Citrobacter sp. MNAZ 1397]